LQAVVAMPMKLFADPKTYLTKKILLAGAVTGLDIEVPKAAGGAEQGRIPVLETEKGCIFGTSAIARYISRLRRDLGLYGQTLLESGVIDSWVDFSTHELEVPLGAWLQAANVPAEVVQRAKSDVTKTLTVLDNHLLHFTFMAGDQLTLADISICCVVHHGMKQVLSADVLKPFTNLRRWFSLCMGQPEFVKVLGKAESCTGAASPKAAPKKEAAPKSEAAAKKEAAPKKEAAAKKEAVPKKEAKKDAKKEEEEAPVVDRKAVMKKVVKEGGKRGVEIEGAADMGGLQFFCTAVEFPDGDLEFLRASLDAMNEKSDPTEEERKGGSGNIGKMVFSCGTQQLAVAAYVPEDKQKDLDCNEWLTKVLSMFPGGKVTTVAKDICLGIVPADGANNIFPMKIREPMILEANNFLRKKGLFPEDKSDSDELVFGDDDFPS